MNWGYTSSTSELDMPPTTNDQAVQRRWYRWHVSSYFALAVTACALALIAIPGQIRDCVRDVMDSYGCHTYVHGWPGVFLERYVEYRLGDDQFSIEPETSPWLHARCWQLTSEGVVTSRKFFPGILAMDAACCLLVLACVGAAAECRRRRRQHIWQFSLTEMLACVVLCAAALGWWRWHRERHAGAVCLAERLGKKGAHFEFGYAGPVWLERLLGTQMLEQAKLPVKVSLYRNHISLINELLAQRDTFRHLKNVDVSSDGGQISVQCIEFGFAIPEAQCHFVDRLPR